jgi:2-polyprenyl-6-hydroxyphenyl methylase/3-demethylubiquinone-9 3-methyltransferase
MSDFRKDQLVRDLARADGRRAVGPPICKCCGAVAGYLGPVAFNKTCEDWRGRPVFAQAGPAIPYHRCGNCGFIFSGFFDDWSMEMFSAHIYNDDYARADPDFVTGGRAPIADTIARLFEPSRGRLRLLDYGAGGNPGHIGRRLIAQGFDVTSYDPFYVEGAGTPDGVFDVVFAIEVIEHCHQPQVVAAEMARLLSDGGILFLATQLHAHPAGADVLKSWYIAPRNGHISIFTLPALTLLFRAVGINIVQSAYGLVGFRKLPDFPNTLFV